MEAVVAHIRELSQKEADLDQLRKTLDQNVDKIQKHGNQIASAVASLEPARHTVGIVFLLFARATLPNVDAMFVNQVENFLGRFNPKHARKVADKLGVVVHRYTEAIREQGHSLRGIRPILAGIQSLRPSPDFLTPLHADLLQLCLKAKFYKPALSILEEQIFDVDPSKTGSRPRDYLLYYYYGAMIYIGLKDFKKAAYFLETALGLPAYAMNAIQVESYKKYVLVSILNGGKFLGLPKTASSIVHRHMKTYCAAYVEFANAYAGDNTDKVIQVAQQFTEVFQKEGNFGLVSQALKALYQRNIQKLTQTYLTLSLQDIARTAQLESAKKAELQVLRMIEDGKINAAINQKDGMVAFPEEAQSASASDIDDRIAKATQLAYRLKAIDDDIASSQSYIARISGVRDDVFDLADRPQRQGGKMSRMFDFFRA